MSSTDPSHSSLPKYFTYLSWENQIDKGKHFSYFWVEWWGLYNLVQFEVAGGFCWVSGFYTRDVCINKSKLYLWVALEITTRWPRIRVIFSTGWINQMVHIRTTYIRSCEPSTYCSPLVITNYRTYHNRVCVDGRKSRNVHTPIWGSKE